MVTVNVFSQNLVINGGFESDSQTQWGFTNKTGWFQLYTADFFHMSVPGPFISIDQKLPRTGEGFVGLYIGGINISPQEDTTASHEYIIGKLQHPLLPERKYHISFWAKPSGTIFDPEEMYTSGHLGAAFLRDTSVLRFNKVSSFQIVLPEDITNPHGPLTDIKNYVKISGCYTATGGERYIVIGNLDLEKNNNLIPLSNDSRYENAYVIVDDVELIEEKRLGAPSDTTICKRENLVLRFDTSTFSEITVNSQPMTDSFIIDFPGNYYIKAYHRDCLIEEEVTVDFEECYHCNFFIPNVFSPNGDGINDAVTISSNCQIEVIESNVYDRWGNQVYYSKNEFNWDGTSGSRYLNKGVYTYLVKVKKKRSNKQKYIFGDITILR